MKKRTEWRLKGGRKEKGRDAGKERRGGLG